METDFDKTLIGLFLLNTMSYKSSCWIHIFIAVEKVQGNDDRSPPVKGRFKSMIFRTSRLVRYVIVPWRVTVFNGLFFGIKCFSL